MFNKIGELFSIIIWHSQYKFQISNFREKVNKIYIEKSHSAKIAVGPFYIGCIFIISFVISYTLIL